MCPPERNALYQIYLSAKGQEWTNDLNWGDEFVVPCFWYGVVCDNDTGPVVGLNLPNNGLSGTLSEMLGRLTSLELLDLSDNDLKGSIPSGIGSLLHLKRLRISYNALTGEIPQNISSLEHLELLHLHGNRLTGSMPDVNSLGLSETSSFISDCGVPSVFDKPLICDNCTMCCNANDEYQPTAKNKLLQIDQSVFESYSSFSWVLLLCLAGVFCLVVILSSLYDSHKEKSMQSMTQSDRRLAKIESDRKYALEHVGDDSVYSFFLTKSWLAWGVALFVFGIQMAMLFLFVRVRSWSSWLIQLRVCPVLTPYLFYCIKAAMVDFSDGKSDFIYSWRCKLNDAECKDTSDQTWWGWMIFAILMVSHLMADLLNGGKLLILSGKARHRWTVRCRFFCKSHN
jgi:hypothetical protein